MYTLHVILPSSLSVGNGSWVREGVTTVNSTTNCGQSVTTVQCASTHLTSFAVLVDVAGGLRVRTRYIQVPFPYYV